MSVQENQGKIKDNASMDHKALVKEPPRIRFKLIVLRPPPTEPEIAKETKPENAKEMDAEIPETSKENKRDLKWVNIEEMLLSLKEDSLMQMEVICALYRYYSESRLGTTIRISERHYQSLKLLAAILTDDKVLDRCVMTSEVLEERFKGSAALCCWFIRTFSRELYHIYKKGLDLYFV